MRRPPLDLSLKLPPRPDDDAVREYYERQLAEGGDDGYESTGYATSGVGESSRRAPPPDPFRHDPALASPPRRRRELPRDDVDAPPAPVDRRAPRSRATAPSPVANGGPFTGDLDRYGDGTSRGAASWRSFGSSADAPSGSGRDPGRRPSLRRGPASTEHAPSEPPSELPTPMPSQRDMAEERDASPARRARRDARAPRADPPATFTSPIATRTAPPRGSTTTATAPATTRSASRRRRTTSSPHLSAIRTDARVIRTVAVRVVVRAPARAPPRSEARRPADRERERRAPTQTRTHEEAMIPRGTREASLRTREEAFSPPTRTREAPAPSREEAFPLEDAPASSHPRSLSASDAAARATEEARLENLKSRGRMTASEVTAHYRRARVRALAPRAARAAPVASGTRNPCGTAIDRVCVV